jgi:GNAT superfamily N-acetyltransferase
MLVFDDQKHIGQLQFRPYVPNTVSPHGLHHPLYWMDFQGQAPDLPEKTLSLFCYHVGQTDHSQARDSRYFGKGIGSRLLKETLQWSKEAGFEAVIAKGCPGVRSIIEYMGGMPSQVYLGQGFKIVTTYLDRELRTVVANLAEGREPDKASEVSVCVRYF